MSAFLNIIHTKNLRGDFLGGLTAAIVSLPLALTFGIASGAGAEAGLYGAILVGLFAAVFGGTPTLISEPTGPMTVVMAAVLTNLISQNPENGIAMAFTVVMMAGVFQIAFGLLKLGSYITLMPYSVISGFMSGIGFILIIMQFAPLLGQKAPTGGVSATLMAAPELISKVDYKALLLAAMTLGILFYTPKKWAKLAPPQLYALIIVSIFSVLAFGANDVHRIGVISASLPSLQFPSFEWGLLKEMIIDAMALGMLGCIDSMLTSVIADNLTRTEHKSNKELIGQGLGNIFSGLFGGLPGAGATMGTVVNIQSGAQTALSGIFRVLILIVAVFGASSLISHIPLAILAAIATKVGLNILDWSFIKKAHRVSKHSTVIMYGVMLLTIFVDLIVAVGIGVFIANIITIAKLSESQKDNIRATSVSDDKLPLTPHEQQMIENGKCKILFFYLSGAMIFGVSKALARQRAAIPAHDIIVIDLSDVALLDDTISLSMENLIKEAIDQGKKFFLVVKTETAREKLKHMGYDALIKDEDFLPNRTAALEKATLRLQKDLALAS